VRIAFSLRRVVLLYFLTLKGVRLIVKSRQSVFCCCRLRLILRVFNLSLRC